MDINIIVGLVIGVIIGIVVGYLWFKTSQINKFVQKEKYEELDVKYRELEINSAKSISQDEINNNYVLKGELEVIKGFLITANSDLEDLRKEINRVNTENAKIDAKFAETNKRLIEQQAFIEKSSITLKEAFTSLSVDALKGNNQSFVELAKAKLDEKVTEAKGEFEKKELAIGQMVKPLGESLEKMDIKIQELEGRRIKAYSDIWNYLDQVKETTEGLKKETTNLVGALKTSHTRGRYGELGLRRLVEHAGMFEHVHFEEQVSVEDESGKLRPDMIIKLPGDKILVVDSKAPLSAYMKIYETNDEAEQKILLGNHILAVKDHLKKLSAKAYWSQFASAPDFVIMYMHIESSYGIASQAWPEMIEEAMKNRIIIATPTVLLSILMGVGYSWNQLKTMENIESIRDAAVELHDRSVTLIEHIGSVGKSLNSTVSHYNKFVGSLEGSFLPQARRINTLSQAYVKKKEIPDAIYVEATVREITTVIKSEEEITNDLPKETLIIPNPDSEVIEITEKGASEEE